MTEKQYHALCDRASQQLEHRVAHTWRMNNWFMVRYGCYEMARNYVRYVRAYSRALVEGR